MAISQVSLSASARANLTALKNTATLLESTQAKLSSGKKVNSALDNASSYFASKGFLNSANDLDSLKDSMSIALQTIEAATDAIESITTIVTQMQGLVNSALQNTTDESRAAYSAQFNDLKDQLDDLADDATFNGTNLVNSLVSSLTVNFNADNTTKLVVQGSNLSTAGMGVGDAVGGWASTSLAQEVTMNLTAAENTSDLTNAVYSGTLTGLSVTDAASQTGTGSGSGAIITSTSQNYTDGARITSVSATTLSNALDATSGLGQTGVTVTTMTAPTDDAGADNSSATGLATIIITGQFTATGGADAIFDTTGLNGSANSITNNTATAADATTITVGVGQTIQIQTDAGDGAAGATITQYTNNTASAISFKLAAAADTVETSGTLSYNGTGASVADALTASTMVRSNSAPGATTATTYVAPTAGATLTVAADADIAAIQAALTVSTETAYADTTVSTTDFNTVTGQFTYLNGAANANAIVVKSGDSIQIYEDDGAGAISCTNYSNTTDHDIAIDIATGATTIAETGSSTNTYYANNATVSYDLGSGTVATTGVTLTNGETLNGNALTDSLGVLAGGTVTVKQTTAAAADAVEGTTTQTGISVYDAAAASITAIGTTGVRATIDGNGNETYSGSDLLVTIDSVKTLTGDSSTLIDQSLSITQAQLTDALSTLRSAASALGNNNTLVQTRYDFTTNLISTLSVASDKLVLADTNEEGANMQALQAQSQLGIVALGISGDQAQAILRLF